MAQKQSAKNSAGANSRPGQRIRDERLRHGWSQAELARRADISRAAVSAIEVDRLVPSVTAALALAECLGCSVSDLFGSERSASPVQWAWPPRKGRVRYWRAEIDGQVLSFPIEEPLTTEFAHDGTVVDGTDRCMADDTPSRTLVLACCDPAAGLLTSQFARISGMRMVVIGRSSRAALKLLAEGRVHAAGIHLCAVGGRPDNAGIVSRELGKPAGLLRIARWEEGVAFRDQHQTTTLQGLLRPRIRWVGREQGSGAEQCQKQILGDRPLPRHVASDHRGVAEALRSGWADAGVCVRLASEEAGLEFLSVRQEDFDLVFAKSMQDDPRIRAIIRVVRSPSYRRLLGDLPGYDPVNTGDLEWTGTSRGSTH
ncbi:MAG TPA: substrate-binding domain-containing protein [Planctomycetaceae bacterium]|jgi:molybdate-binding protein/DNA-binding XRE family transcriptional regulator|nr:substrate-binding domain-containing protein [Planctomycetaceae bacterium]